MNADRLFLEAAIELAEKGRFTCSPNPPVGCLICKDGEIIGRGFHDLRTAAFNAKPIIHSNWRRLLLAASASPAKQQALHVH